MVGGGTGALLGGALGSLATRGDMIPIADSIRAVEQARSEAFDMGVSAAKQGLV